MFWIYLNVTANKSTKNGKTKGSSRSIQKRVGGISVGEELGEERKVEGGEAAKKVDGRRWERGRTDSGTAAGRRLV